MRNGAPEAAWRTTKMSACMAERFATVSRSDSPFVADDTAMLRLITSAERRFAAISKVVRVRVEGSKKRLNTLLPRSNGTFFTSRSVTPAKDSAVSRICRSTSRGRPSIESRCRSSPFELSCGLRCTVGLERQDELRIIAALEPQPQSGRHLDARAAMLCTDRQLPAATIGEHDQRDALRAPVVEKLIHRGAHRAAGIEHVVDQQQIPAGDIERDPAALGIVVQALRVVVVAVERDVHEAERLGYAEHRVQPLGEPRTAGVNADHRGAGPDHGFEIPRELLTDLLGVRQLHRSTARG